MGNYVSVMLISIAVLSAVVITSQVAVFIKSEHNK